MGFVDLNSSNTYPLARRTFIALVSCGLLAAPLAAPAQAPANVRRIGLLVLNLPTYNPYLGAFRQGLLGYVHARRDRERALCCLLRSEPPICGAENDAKAEAIAQQYALWVYHVGLRMPPLYCQPPGYTTEAWLRRLLSTGGKMPTELIHEDLEEGGYIICGSPATGRDKLGIFSEELKAGILCSGMNGGSHEATLDMMRMFGEEVMPHFRQDAAVDETVGVGR